MKAIVRAPGKLILLGEYAVLENAPALVIAVNRFAEIEIESNRSHFVVSAPTINVESAGFTIQKTGVFLFEKSVDEKTRNRLRFFKAIFETTGRYLAEQKIELPPVQLKLNTDSFFDRKLKSKLGLGSSAALTVATCAGILTAAGIDINEIGKQIVFDLSFRAHRQAQGKIGSGIDIATSVFGGVLRYEMGREPVKEESTLNDPKNDPGLFVLPIWSGQSMSTRRMVSKTNVFKKEQPQSYQKVMNRLIHLARQGCDAFRKKNFTGFVRIVDLYHDALHELGRNSRAPIISKQHHRLAKIVRYNGAVYKPSGAGGGDLGLAFANTAEIIQKVSEETERQGYFPVNLEVDRKGVFIINH